jgi:hypothetical protein
VKGHSSRLAEAEDRISELKDELEIKGKAEEQLVKQLKTYEKICKNSPTPSKV